jgi:hypothetical protein
MDWDPKAGDLLLETRRESVSAIGRVEAPLGVAERADYSYAWRARTTDGDVVDGLEPIGDGVWQRRTERGAIDLRAPLPIFRRPLGCA